MKIHKCDTCEYKGYSPELCRLHYHRLAQADREGCKHHSSLYQKVGKTTVVGAGAGLAAGTLGIALAPVVGLKALIGHFMAAKLAFGGGAAGAGTGAGIGVLSAKKTKKRGINK